MVETNLLLSSHHYTNTRITLRNDLNQIDENILHLTDDNIVQIL